MPTVQAIRAMLVHSTILGHLAGWGLSRRFEDAATEGLAYMLRYEEAKSALVNYLRTAEPSLPWDLNFGTQYIQGDIRPDMVGRTQEEAQLFIENKFGAELTENQPNAYLDALAQSSMNSLLLFVAPRRRTSSLWPELYARITSKYDESQIQKCDAKPNFVELWQLGPRQKIALTTWTIVLNRLRDALEHNPAALADLRQLKDLCDAASVNENSPLTDAELSDERVPTRLLQYGRIVQDVVASAPEHLLNTQGLRPGHSWSAIGRYFQFAGEGAPGAWLGVNLELWMGHAESDGPLWLHFLDSDFGQARRCRDRLEGWARQHERTLVHATDGSLAVSLNLPVAREHAAVVQAVQHQLSSLHATLLDENFAERR